MAVCPSQIITFEKLNQMVEDEKLELDSPEEVVLAQAAKIITNNSSATDWGIISAMFGVSKIAENTYRLYRSQSFGDEDYPARVLEFFKRIHKVSPEISAKLIKYIILREVKPEQDDLDLFPQLSSFVQTGIIKSVIEPVIEKEPSIISSLLQKRTGIFISYSHQDKPFAKKLARDLQHQSVDVWIDEGEIKLGDSLIRKIEDGINSMDYVAVVLSPESVESSWVQKEVEIAMTQEINGKRVIVLPLLYKDCNMPTFLQDKFYADFRLEEIYTKSLKLILDRVGASWLCPYCRKDPCICVHREGDKII